MQQLNDERQQRAELEMKLMEMGKLSTSMAQKASEENVLKALRTYVNRSKRKMLPRRWDIATLQKPFNNMWTAKTRAPSQFGRVPM